MLLLGRAIGRLIGLLGATASATLRFVFLVSNPAGEGGATDATHAVVALMVTLAMLGIVAAWKARPYLMIAVFVLSFLPMGLYLLGTPGMYRWIGVFDFLYLVSGILMISRSKPKTA